MGARKRIIEVGEVYNDWTVIAVFPLDSADKKHAYRKCRVRCSCGNEAVRYASTVKAGISNNCGCKRSSRIAVAKTKHGMVDTPEYRAWTSMKRRCSSPKSDHYYLYGGRGITVCERWAQDFRNFFADLGPRPGPNYSLDRIDSNGNYEPDNCRWATLQEQARNTRRNVWVERGGEILCMADWCKRLGIIHTSVQNHIRCGSTPAEAINRVLAKRSMT